MPAAPHRAAPASPPSPLPRPSGRWGLRAGLAVTLLLAFLILYMAAAAWFVLVAVQLLAEPLPGGDAPYARLAGVCAAVVAGLMIKGLTGVRRGDMERDVVQVTAAQQPDLFRFVHEIADAAGAPRPRRVLLSPRVHAGVSRDVSLMHLLLFPRKDLEIGLGLVNVLTREELRAVLAHEFGHLAQRSSAMGRWVYVAQRAGAHLGAPFDVPDGCLSRGVAADGRIAPAGTASGRTLRGARAAAGAAIRFVAAIPCALARQMERDADMVAVHLTGSDALVHALHRSQAAEDSWDRASRFIAAEHQAGRTAEDAFCVQARILAHMRHVLDDPHYGAVAPVPADDPQAHRVFQAGPGRPPRMWQAHTPSHEREAHAKARYIPSLPDNTSAWSVFEDALRLRRHLTASMLDAPGAEPAPLQETLQRLDERFSREYLKPRYRGIYLDRSSVRHVVDPLALYDHETSGDLAAHALLYPPALAADMEALRALEAAIARQRAMHGGAPGGDAAARWRGEPPRGLPSGSLAASEQALAQVRKRLHAHDAACRAWHAAAAQTVGRGWPEYLEGLLRTVHYADHTAADLADAHGAFRRMLARETAPRRFGKAARRRVLMAAQRLYRVLETIYEDRDAVRPGPVLGTRMAIGEWAATFGSLELVYPSARNLENWLAALHAWVRRTVDLLSLLRDRALEELLVAESRLAAHVLRDAALDDAPLDADGRPPRVPEFYTTLLPGQERAHRAAPRDPRNR